MRFILAGVGTIVCLLITIPTGAGEFEDAARGFLRSSNDRLRNQATLHLRRLTGQAQDRLVGPNFDPRQAASRALANTSRRTRVWRNADVRVAANGDVSLVRRQSDRAASRRENDRNAQPGRLDLPNRDRGVRRNADRFLAKRLAHLDEMRDEALERGDVQTIIRAESLEREARSEHLGTFQEGQDNE